MLERLTAILDVAHSWPVECLALFLIPFFHEDVAILGGSLMIVDDRLPVVLAFASLLAGMISSDIALYGLGALARRTGWIRRRLLQPRMERLGFWLGGRIFYAVAIARLVPGLMFPVYLACGYCRVSFAKFAWTTIVTAAVYLPVTLYLASRLGEAAAFSFEYWSWVAGIALTIVVISGLIRGQRWQFLLRPRSSPGGASHAAPVAFPACHRGMPTVDDLQNKISFAEKIPPVLFYVPLVVQWFLLAFKHGSLALPALANPRIETGGLWGESKSSYLDMVGAAQRCWLADYTTFRRGTGPSAANADTHRALAAARASGLDLPLVAKPDIGWRGFGVRLIQSVEELERYIRSYPEGENIILQRPIEYEGEAGVLYARIPGEPTGKIVSLTFRYFPYVVGDGSRAICDLILTDQRAAWKAGHHLGLDAMHNGGSAEALERVPAAGETVRLSFIGSNRVGGLYRDARDHITAELTARFDQISRSLPEFYYGRFDIRFSSVDALRRGEDFRIIEINGAGGEAINVWEPSMPLGRVYRELFAQQRLLFAIGAKNLARGHRPPRSLDILRSQWRQHNLILRYPPSS